MDNKVLDLIMDSIKDLKETVNNRLDKIENKLDNVVTKEDCKNNQGNCLLKSEEKKTAINAEWSYKKYVVVASIFTGFFGVAALFIKGLFPHLGV